MIPIGIAEGQRRVPWLTFVLASANIYIFWRTSSSPDFDRIKLAWGFIPQFGCLATLLTHMFLHDNWAHLLGNTIFFLVPGMKLEDAIGPRRFALVYLTGGFAANAAHAYLASDLPAPMIGASGAIAAIVGAFMTLYPTSRMIFWILPPLPLTIMLPAWFFLGFWFFRELGMGYFMRIAGVESPIAVWAHVGGFLYGAALMRFEHGWSAGRRLEARRPGGWLGWAKPWRNGRNASGRALALALQACAWLYAAMVWIQGGIVNTDRPTTQRAMMVEITRTLANRQTAQDLYKEALERGSGAGEYGSRPRRALHRHIWNESIPAMRRHEQIRRGLAYPPFGYSADLRRFLAIDLASFPMQCQFRFDSLAPLGVLYAPGREFELYGGSTSDPERLFVDLLVGLHECGWAIEAPAFDRRAQMGLISATNGEWRFTISVVPGEFLAGAPSLALAALAPVRLG